MMFFKLMYRDRLLGFFLTEERANWYITRGIDWSEKAHIYNQKLFSRDLGNTLLRRATLNDFQIIEVDELEPELVNGNVRPYDYALHVHPKDRQDIYIHLYLDTGKVMNVQHSFGHMAYPPRHLNCSIIGKDNLFVVEFEVGRYDIDKCIEIAQNFRKLYLEDRCPFSIFDYAPVEV